MIEVKGLKKEFDGLKVLNGIDYTINQGEKIVVIGPSGSGKSTFLRCLNLLEEPTGLTIRVNFHLNEGDAERTENRNFHLIK